MGNFKQLSDGNIESSEQDKNTGLLGHHANSMCSFPQPPASFPHAIIPHDQTLYYLGDKAAVNNLRTEGKEGKPGCTKELIVTASPKQGNECERCFS